MKLKKLCEQHVQLQSKHENIEITGLSIDSRKIQVGNLFIALPGILHDGIDYIPQAIANGASAVLCEESSNMFSQANIITDEGIEVPIYSVVHLVMKLGNIAAIFYQHPSTKVNLIGITGTNGKTSTAYFIADSFNKLNKKCGLLGTIGNGYPGKLINATHTTSDAISVQNALNVFEQDNASAVAMEVSSHGLDQGRVNGCEFDIAIFTNLTHEHLDYHGDMHHYGQAKRKLFQMPGLRYAVFNIDDDFGMALFQEFNSLFSCYAISLNPKKSIDKSQLIFAKDITQNEHGIQFQLQTPWGESKIDSSLFGKFNVYNLLSTAATLGILQESWMSIVKALNGLTGVPGRMQVINVPGRAKVIIDYSHTPDALSNALDALSEHQFGRIWCVFGCGGDRDKSKRPVMGEIASKKADQVIITNDNPRTEIPETIADEIKAGISNPQALKVILDRKAAIQMALANANIGDVVLIAGKGHETYQEINGIRHDFSDQQIVNDFFKELA